MHGTLRGVATCIGNIENETAGCWFTEAGRMQKKKERGASDGEEMEQAIQKEK